MTTPPALDSLYKDWLVKTPDVQHRKGLSPWMKAQRWKGIGSSEHLLWGEVKTRGSLYYKVVLDKQTQTQRCTCAHISPPCSHAIALLTGWHEGILEANTDHLPPNWVEERLISKSNTKTSKENTSKVLGDQRMAEMMAGYTFLRTWLRDQTMEGWRRTLDPPATQLEEVAARLVNDRLPGPARLLRSLTLPPTLTENTTSRFLSHLATLTIATRIFLQGPENQTNTWPHLLQFSGITLRKDQIRKQEPTVEDHWIQLAQVEEQEEGGLQQRTSWVFGMHHKRFALILDFAWKRQPLPPALPSFPILSGTMTFYPGSQNLRAIPEEVSRSDRSLASTNPAYSSWSAFFDWLIVFRTVDPFTPAIPAWVEGQFLQQDNDTLAWADHEGRKLPLVCTSSQRDFFLSFLGLSKLSLFGLVYLHQFQPLALFSQGEKIDF